MSAACAPLPTARAAAAAAITGLAATHVALHEAHHRPRGREIGIDLRECAALRAGERERQCGDETGLESLRVAQRRGRRRLQRVLHQAQCQLVREQLLEGKPALRWVAAGGEHFELRVARRAMHVLERARERRQAQRIEDARRQPFAHPGRAQLAERLQDEPP